MPRYYLSIHSLITVRGRQYDYVYTPRTIQDLADIALGLLIDELGTEKARLHLRAEFATYRRDYRGVQRDDRPAKLDQKPLPSGASETWGRMPPGN
ncbi:hypothetical protein PSGK_18795 [Pseudomonas solani]|uniref:hypothetical protein n=1 Tax=Pseudomonas solani TaxID=2731552 RepID=UPI0035BE9AFA